MFLYHIFYMQLTGHHRVNQAKGDEKKITIKSNCLVVTIWTITLTTPKWHYLAAK